MGFPGSEKLQADAARSAGGGWVKLIDDQPVRLTVLEYVGTTTSKKYPDNVQYRFTVLHNGGPAKSLDCNWRLMKALKDMAETMAGPFTVTLTQSKVIAEITDASGAKSKKLVNDYTLKDVVEAAGPTPF